MTLFSIGLIAALMLATSLSFLIAGLRRAANATQQPRSQRFASYPSPQLRVRVWL
jgi:hypothetical protein